MANFNFAFGGDIHYNANYAMYPQNAYVSGRPEFGASETPLKPAHHWEGGHYASVRHMSFNDEQHQVGIMDIASEIVAGDTFITHVIPSGSLLTGFHFNIHVPADSVAFTLRLASDSSVIGVVDGSTSNSGWFQLTTPVFIPDDVNDAIEWVVDGWPDTTPDPVDADPCGVYGPCEKPVNFCFTSTAFFQNHRSEDYCQVDCWD